MSARFLFQAMELPGPAAANAERHLRQPPMATADGWSAAGLGLSVPLVLWVALCNWKELTQPDFPCACMAQAAKISKSNPQSIPAEAGAASKRWNFQTL